ncbi:Cyclindependent kinase 11Blike [Caligus rogercresseyi]|uniref:Cyclindependent kinase 11Blike n=1 Tax=Caligus rogercresseyi TaxID=217165 RepID=A0A7T8GML6_CALRO|nr:Cyclindependent kinase 11Blike [Caligus rogercresseyi]QQP33049.1 Cyclindependent kinase 11Blike [Caligus rogercresseyi]
MDFVEHDLKSLMETMRSKKQSFLPGEVKCLMIQLLKAISHLHDNWILHRDLNHNGILKVGDFGLAREYGSPLKPYTAIVVTLWYRAPELLLGIKEYTTHIDVWSIGCLFGEFLLMEPLFPGKSDIDQLNRIFKLLGTPSEKIWPGYNSLPAVQKMKFTGLHLLKRFFTYDPSKRLSCEEALGMDYFRETPLPIDPSMFPTWPAKSELGSGAPKKAASPKPPSGKPN